METGLRILIQLVLEFAPVIAVLIQKRDEVSQDQLKHNFGKENLDFIQDISNLISIHSSARELEKEKFFQQQLAAYHRQTQLKLAEIQRETALKLPETHKILDNWPLRLYPSQILDSHASSGSIPLRVFLAPPKVQFEQIDDVAKGIPEIEIEHVLAEGLREFLNQHYFLHSQIRPTEFLAGAWESKRFHSESSIKALFSRLKSEPTLVLESEISGDYLNFRIACWGFGQENYYYKTIAKLPYKEVINQAAKVRALEWRRIREELINIGESPEEIDKLGGDNNHNLLILEKEEAWRNKGIDTSQLSLDYQISPQDTDKLCQILITCHCLAAGWIADVYHLVQYDVPPLLPKLLPSLLEANLDSQSAQAFAKHTLSTFATGYKQLYQALAAERHYWIPELALQLAQSLSYLPDKSWTQEQLNYSINTWLQLRQVLQPEGSNSLEAMQLALRVEDREYVEKLREYFAALGDIQRVAQVDELLQAIANLQHQRQLEYAYLRTTLSEHKDQITSVAISEDGQTLVSGSLDKTIKVWNLTTGKLICTLTNNSGKISSVDVSNDGQIIVGGSYDCPRNNIKLWHLPTGKVLHTFLGHKKPVNFVTISPDGKILASGSNKIKIWRLDQGQRLQTLWHSCSVNTAAIAPEGKIIASGYSDSRIRLWHLHQGELLQTLTGHTDEVRAIAISPDGQTLISGSADKTIKIWQLQTGKVVYSLAGHIDEVRTIAINPDGQTLISGSADRTIKIWRMQTGELLNTLAGHSGAVNTIAISPDGQLIVSGSSDRTIKIWQVA